MTQFKTVGISIEPELLARVDQRVDQEDLTRSSYFRRLAKRDLEKSPDQIVRVTIQSRDGSGVATLFLTRGEVSEIARWVTGKGLSKILEKGSPLIPHLSSVPASNDFRIFVGAEGILDEMTAFQFVLTPENLPAA